MSQSLVYVLLIFKNIFQKCLKFKNLPIDAQSVLTILHFKINSVDYFSKIQLKNSLNSVV